MKPIEPGCLAMVVGAKCDIQFNGRVVRVKQPHAMASAWLREPWWVIEATDERDLIAERCLMRIDGGEGERVTEPQAAEVSV